MAPRPKGLRPREREEGVRAADLKPSRSAPDSLIAAEGEHYYGTRLRRLLR